MATTEAMEVIYSVKDICRRLKVSRGSFLYRLKQGQIQRPDIILNSPKASKVFWKPESVERIEKDYPTKGRKLTYKGKPTKAKDQKVEG